jgi:predicted Rossmann fold nucleotide-binding protein DprA/Smf involved in DNA uptake
MVPLFNVDYHSIPASSLGDRDSDILAFLGEEDFAFFTFEGLKRRLGLHPETLSRILNRLEQEGIVKKTNEGYTVTREIAKHLKLHPTNTDESRVSLLQTYLPSDMPVQQLVSSLRGRWFGLLRWLGVSETNENITLKWITEDGDIQIDAKITETQLNIEAKFLHHTNLNRALKAAYQLMAYIGKLCARTPMARHVAYFDDSSLYSMPT